jgi:hypothetical protein
MVEICVAIADPTSAYGLMRGLGELFGRSAVSFDSTSGEVRVRSEWESRAVMEVIEVVDRWLATDGIASAKLSIGGRSHTLVGPAWLPPTRRRAA